MQLYGFGQDVDSPSQVRVSRTAANLGLVPNVRNILGLLKAHRQLCCVARQAFAT